jgi:hypothetical protein
MWVERRKHRSELPTEAASFQLAYCARKFDINTFCLADERGVVVASAMTSHEEEVLAAYAPLLYRTRAHQERLGLLTSLQELIPRLEQRRISVRRFLLEGQEMFLCALGERGEEKERGMRQAIFGLQRILLD